VIYFLRAGTDGHVKIGWTRNDTTLERRGGGPAGRDRRSAICGNLMADA
jgi:hypothetical protein